MSIAGVGGALVGVGNGVMAGATVGVSVGSGVAVGVSVGVAVGSGVGVGVSVGGVVGEAVGGMGVGVAVGGGVSVAVGSVVAVATTIAVGMAVASSGTAAISGGLAAQPANKDEASKTNNKIRFMEMAPHAGTMKNGSNAFYQALRLYQSRFFSSRIDGLGNSLTIGDNESQVATINKMNKI